MKRRYCILGALGVTIYFLLSSNREQQKNLKVKTNEKHRSGFWVPDKTGNVSTQWNGTSPIMFLHIGKTGGTSFDNSMNVWDWQNNRRRNPADFLFQKDKGKLNPVEFFSPKFIGHKHFDWTVIESKPNSVAVTLLRNPIDRAFSHFNFMKVSFISRLYGFKINLELHMESRVSNLHNFRVPD